MRRSLLRCSAVAAALLACGAFGAGVAAAHGPCGCLEPRVVEAGRQVRIGSPAYRVLFNPRPRDLGIAPAYLAAVPFPGADRIASVRSGSLSATSGPADSRSGG